MRHSASRASRFTGAASILTLAGLLAGSSAQAATPSVTSQFQHFIDCAGWLFSDPAKHAQDCAPGHTVFVSSSTGSGAVPPPSDPEDNG